MSKNNYEPWKIDINSFKKKWTNEDTIRFLLSFAILAPSSHNAQPWLFKIQNDTLEILENSNRHLIKSDKDKRMLYIALGATLANLKLAADAYGINYSIKYHMPKPSLAMVTINFKNLSIKNIENEAILQAIKDRSSYRAKFSNKKINEDIIKNVLKNQKYNSIFIQIFSDSSDKKTIASIVGAGMKDKMSDKSFRQELASWLRYNYTNKKDGMPGFGHEMSLFLSIIAPWILRFIDVSKVEEQKAIKRVNAFPKIAIISSRKDNPAEWIAVGEMLEEFIVKMELYSIKTSIMVAGIESQNARKKLEYFLFKKTNQNSLPQILFGFGYPTKTVSHSPRLSVSDVLI